MSVNPEENPILSESIDENSSILDVISSTKNIDESPSISDLFPIVDAVPIAVNTGQTLEEKQEQTRSQLAGFLVKIFAGTIIGSFVLFSTLVLLTMNIDEKKAGNLDKTSILVKDLITLIVTSQTGLIGSALGFYFGSRNNNSK